MAAARAHRFVLVHVSSDYVFDGTQELHTEDEALSAVRAAGGRGVEDVASLILESDGTLSTVLRDGR